MSRVPLYQSAENQDPTETIYLGRDATEAGVKRENLAEYRAGHNSNGKLARSAMTEVRQRYPYRNLFVISNAAAGAGRLR